MKTYNQTQETYSRMWCTLYSLFTIMEFNFWLEVSHNFILKALHYFEKLGKWSHIQWAIFSIIYPAFIWAINKKLWLKFKIIKKNLNILTDEDTLTFWIWVKRYNKFFKVAERRWMLIKQDVDDMVAYTGKTYMHNMLWDWSKGWYLINTDWTAPFTCSKELLRYMAKEWILWYPVRTIVPADTRTKRIVDITIQMKKAESRNRTFNILKKDYDIKNTILKLYNYGK